MIDVLSILEFIAIIALTIYVLILHWRTRNQRYINQNLLDRIALLREQMDGISSRLYRQESICDVEHINLEIAQLWIALGRHPDEVPNDYDDPPNYDYTNPAGTTIEELIERDRLE